MALENKTYTIVFTDQSSSTNAKIVSGTGNPENQITSGANAGGGNSKRTFEDGFTKKIGTSVIQQTVVSPLNSVTGGAAGQVYSVGKALLNGGAAAIGGAVAGAAIFAVTSIIGAIQKRIQRLEAEAAEANARDNVLIKAGYIDLYGVNLSKGRYGRINYNRGS